MTSDARLFRIVARVHPGSPTASMKLRETLVARVLELLHGEPRVTLSREPLPLSATDVDYLCATGLGPATHGLCKAGLVATGASDRSRLQGADLTCQLLYRRMAGAAEQICARLNAREIVPVLLKGISTSRQYYRTPHHRVLGDVDLLVDATELATARSVLRELGYDDFDAESLGDAGATHHHLPAVIHPDTRVIVELHAGLFPPATPAAGSALFQPRMFRRELDDTRLGDAAARRFSTEFQLAYTVAHWAGDRKWPVNVISIQDALLMLSPGQDFDFDKLRGWMTESPWLAGVIVAMVHCLTGAELLELPRDTQRGLTTHARRIGRTNLRALGWLIAQYPLTPPSSRPAWPAEFQARIAWRALLGQRSRMLRVPVAVSRALVNRRTVQRFNPLAALRRYRKRRTRNSSGA